MNHKSNRIAVLCGLFVVCMLGGFFQEASARGFLQKNLGFVADGKPGECKYWSVFLGNYPCNIIRNFPGDSGVNLKVDINFMLVSSGYIEGNGYSTRGRIDSKAQLYLVTDGNKRELPMDEVASIRDNGQTIETTKGEKGNLLLVCEGNEFNISQLLLRKFNVKVDQGDSTLVIDERVKDMPVSSISFPRGKTQKGR
jgi:hypothetical protein